MSLPKIACTVALFALLTTPAWADPHGGDGTLFVFPGFFNADLNGDGRVDLLDLDILGTNFGASPAVHYQGDINGDNVVDLLDLDILGSGVLFPGYHVGPPAPGDANGDGVTDLLDLDILGTHFGLSPATHSQGDFNGDNSVDLLDMDAFAHVYCVGNQCFLAVAVPEPTSWWMVASVLSGFLTVHGRRRCSLTL